MSGHSKWSQIKRQKGSADVERGVLFSKLSNAITLAARSGGDPNANPKLRLAIERAKNENMPRENIERAIARGAYSAEVRQLQEVRYEAFGPGGAAIIVEALTDNRNRTSSELKHTLSVHGGSLAGQGSVAWMFERRGILRIETTAHDEHFTDKVITAALDSGALDYREGSDKALEVLTVPESLLQVRTSMEQKGIRVQSARINFLPKELTEIETRDAARLSDLLDALDSMEDVQECYTNVGEGAPNN